MALCNLSIMRAKVQLYVETTKDFLRFLAILYWFCQGNTWFFEGGGLEGDICYCPKAGFAWCAVLWYPAVAKGVGTRAEAADAMDGDGGTDTKTEY